MTMKDKCKYCGQELEFDQPYPIHAGFNDEGFLYNDEGNLTLTWSSYDPDYESIVGDKQPWDLSEDQRNKFESRLWPSPSGGKWSFQNPIRCIHCHQPFSGPITETIYYFRYKGSIETDIAESSRIKLRQLLKTT